ncbi:MAG: YcxB family protein [Clostridia bacterium]|nr:YcxB family protein [Clostridia bacterium]
MELQYQPTIDDLVEEGLWAFRTNKAIKSKTTVSNAVCAFLFGALIYVSFDNFEFSVGSILCGALACALSLVFMPKTMAHSLRRRTKKLLKGPNGQKLLSERHYSFTSKGLRAWSETFEKIYPYSDIKAIEIHKDYLLLPFHNGMGLQIPLRAFENDTQRENFLNELRVRRGGAQ